jgi:hypothetical protein
MSSIAAVGAVVYPDSDMISIFTTDGSDDIVVNRSGAVDVAAPWSTGQGEAKADVNAHPGECWSMFPERRDDGLPDEIRQ